MKPADRALNMVVVGLGQAGGNLATEFARLGYRAIALNTAHTDLSSLASSDRAVSLSSDQRIYIGIDGYDGAGADMNYGRECIRENAERIREAVARHAEGADVVIITAGLGGGTGSSVSELVHVLSALDLPMIALATLPNEYESGIAKVNAVRAVSDLVKHENVGWIFADNSRLSHLHGGVSLDKYFEKVNSVIIRPLDEFNRLNERKGIHPIRTLDGEDFRALLLSNGVLNYAEGVLPVLTVEAVIERVRENLQQSTMMPHGFSPEEVAYMGVVLEAGEEVLRGTPFSFFEQLNEQLKHETGGAAIYMGVYRLDNAVEGGSARIRLIASTQSLPEGIQAMVNDARREGGTLRDKLQRSMSSLDLGEIEEFDLFRTTLRSGQHGQQSSRRRPQKPQLALPDLNLRRASDRPSRQSSAVPSTPAAPAEADADPDPAPSANRVATAPGFSQHLAATSQHAGPVVTTVVGMAAPEPEAPSASWSGSGPVQNPVQDPVQDPPQPLVFEEFSDQHPERALNEAVGGEEASIVGDLLDDSEFVAEGTEEEVPESDEVTREFQVESLLNAPPSMQPDEPRTGAKYPLGSAEYNALESHRQSEAASYQKLVATFLRTEFDSTRRRVARRLDAARRADDALTRDLAETALDRLREEGQLAAFEDILQDGASASL